MGSGDAQYPQLQRPGAPETLLTNCHKAAVFTSKTKQSKGQRRTTHTHIPSLSLSRSLSRFFFSVWFLSYSLCCKLALLIGVLTQ